MGAQIENSPEFSDISTPEYHGRKCPAGMDAPVYSEAVEGPELRASAHALPSRELMPTQPTVDHPLSRSSCGDKEYNAVLLADPSRMSHIERSTQEPHGDTVPEAATQQSQRPMQIKAKRQSEYTPLQCVRSI